tara:strand:+ start:735 stop:1496 length:762 start_codon:yes stop_codon:yes gene_type:complete
VNANQIARLLEQVREGALAVDDAVGALANLPFEDLGFAHVDHHREIRKGFPEVIFCQGKQSDHVVEIARRIIPSSTLLATRVNEETRQALTAALPEVEHNRLARTAHRIHPDTEPPKTRGWIAVVSAGTSDLPVAEEAAVTATVMGNEVERVFDVGVAGIHRLLAYREWLLGASVVIVVAGMEGALPSVVGGLVDAPVIAVPTSVGYGASFGGLAALLGMLNSCSSGVTVVNIDNGFGAGYAASLINRQRSDG